MHCRAAQYEKVWAVCAAQYEYWLSSGPCSNSKGERRSSAVCWEVPEQEHERKISSFPALPPPDCFSLCRDNFENQHTKHDRSRTEPMEALLGYDRAPDSQKMLQKHLQRLTFYAVQEKASKGPVNILEAFCNQSLLFPSSLTSSNKKTRPNTKLFWLMPGDESVTHGDSLENHPFSLVTAPLWYGLGPEPLS